jgi:hypothetical protein
LLLLLLLSPLLFSLLLQVIAFDTFCSAVHRDIRNIIKMHSSLGNIPDIPCCCCCCRSLRLTPSALLCTETSATSSKCTAA